MTGPAGKGVNPLKGSGIWVFMLLMIPVGVVLFLIPSTTNMVMKHFHLAEGLGGLQMLFFQVGFLASALTVTLLLQRFSVRIVVLLGMVLLTVFLLAASLSPWYPLLLFCYVIAGYGEGLLFSLSGIYNTHVLRERSSLVQGYMLGFMASGYIVGPLVTGLVERTGISWRWAIAIPALIVVPFIVMVALAHLKTVTGVETLSLSSLREAFESNRSLLVTLMLSVFLAAGGYLCIVNWSVAFLENERAMVMGAAHIVLAVIGLGVAFGRITTARLSARFSPTRVILAAAVASMVLAFFAPIPASGLADAVLLVIAAVSSSGIYPVILGQSSRFPKSVSPAVFSALTASLTSGALLLPFISGLLQEHAGRIQGMSSIAVVFLLLVCVMTYQLIAERH